MLRLSNTATAVYTVNIFYALGGLSAPLLGLSDAAGVFSGLTIASFSGSGQNSIQSVVTDSGGNLYVAGTTSSMNFPVLNAAQPVIGESRILRSTDLGVTWTHMGLPPSDVNVVVPDPVSAQVIFAGGNAGLFKSTDGGQSWTTVYQFQSLYSFGGTLVIDPGNHLRLATVTPFTGAVLRSLDGGQTWSVGGKACPISNCGGSLIVDPSGSGALIVRSLGLYISRDWGLTFQPLYPGGFGTPIVAAFDPSNPGWIYADTGAGTLGSLALSKDFGVTWTAKASPSTPFSAMLGLEVDPDQSNVLVAATPDGFYKSSDGAGSWTRQPSPGFSPETHDPFALVSHKCSPTGGMFAIGSSFGGTSHIDFSPDDGVTWMTPQLTGVTDIAMGPGCTAYATRPAGSDAFVAKLAPDGTVQWATFLGGSDQDGAVALAVDTQGNVYVAGNTSSPDFPVTVPMLGVPGQGSVFVAKLLPDGKIAFSATIGGERVNTASAIAVDLSGSVYVAGHTSSVSFPVTPGVLFSTLDPNGFTGFLAKFSATAGLAYSTLLGTSYTYPGAILVDSNNQVVIAGTGAGPGLPPPPNPGNAPGFIVKLNQTASQAVSGAYLQSVNPGASPTGLAVDANGNLLVFGVTTASPVTATPGAYTSPPSLSSCMAFPDYTQGQTAFLLKLDPSTLQPVYNALLSAPCGIQSGTIAVDPSGAVVLAMETGAGLALQNPFLAGPGCGYSSSAIAKLSGDGSSLQFATYIDGCGIPAVAVARNGSIYAGVPSITSGFEAVVLNFNAANPAGVSLNQVSNAFSGDASAVTAGGLYSLAASGFQPGSIDLGINPSQNLPQQLGGVRVSFDGIPASILQVAPGRVIVAAPERLTKPRRGSAPPKFTSIQISYNGSLSNPVWMPVSACLPGVLTGDNLNPQPHANAADGLVQNQDGTPNGANNPAAIGSTIKLFVTGMGATTPSVAPGSIAHSTAISPDAAVYPTWQVFSFNGPNAAATVSSIPGYVSAMFQIPLVVPASVESRGQPDANGVYRVLVGLQRQLAVSSFIPTASNLVGVYVK